MCMHFEIFLHIQYVKKLFETNKGNFSGSKPIIGMIITFNPEEIGAFGLEQIFYIKFSKNDLGQFLPGSLIDTALSPCGASRIFVPISEEVARFFDSYIRSTLAICATSVISSSLSSA